MKKGHEWKPLSEDVLSNQIAAYDRVRSRCPVAHSEQVRWSIFRHEDVMRVLHSPNVFNLPRPDWFSCTRELDILTVF